MSTFGKDARRQRLINDLSVLEDQTIPTRTYNLIMGLTVFYGIAMNVLICNIIGNPYEYMNPIVFLIAYFILCFAGISITYKSKNPIISFLGYNLVVLPVGVVVSSCVYAYGGLNSAVVQEAFLITMVITGVMVFSAWVRPDLFEKLGGILLTVLCGMLLAEIIMMIFGISQTATAWIGAVIFSLYIGYDFYRSQQFAKTIDNAVDCALDIYMDIINLFLRIMQILGKKKN